MFCFVRGIPPRRVVILICLLLLVAGGFWLYWPQIQIGLRAVEPSCTVGLSGTAAQLTIQGWQAEADCEAILNGKASFLGDPNKPENVYAVSQPQGTILCELDMKGRHLMVRDQGAVTLMGSGLCQELEGMKK
ncbi:MAG TPA: hypothetical protein VKR06_01335 [Ktedonosporobacter sp.]|nr:hypothetical protein [Ktedonosporobacter sp.]